MAAAWPGSSLGAASAVGARDRGADQAGGAGCGPLVRTAETAQQLAVGETGARAPTDGPREIAEVGRSLNRLADRIDELIAEERETVADLSHRLRTPLTTLRLDTEALHDPVEAERVGQHVNALERMLTAVIHAARRPQREGRLPSSDAREVTRDRVEYWSALTEDQGRSCTVTLPPEPVLVRAGAEDLAAAVDALLERRHRAHARGHRLLGRPVRDRRRRAPRGRRQRPGYPGGLGTARAQ